DYMVLLPSAYYEAPILQLRVTEPCTYGPGAQNSQHVELRGSLPGPGDYVLVVEFSSEEQSPQTLSVVLNTPGSRSTQHHLTLLHCTYSFLCRVVAIDDQSRVAVFSLSSDAEVQLTSDRASFFLHKAFLVPREQFTMEYVEPKVHCISTHGQFSPDSSACVPSRFYTPSDSLVLKEGQGSSIQEPVLASPPAAPPLDPWHQADQQPWTGGGTNAAVYSARVHSLGRYVFILHYHQPLHPSYPVQVFINGGRIWQGHVNASFCPHGYGCRGVLVAENQIILDVTDHEIFLTVQIPEEKTLWLDYVLVVPESRYSSSYLNEEPLDKSYDFISSCGQNSFHIDPSSASPFCLSSAISLSAFFNNGALPCACHEVGAQSDACQHFGGQCECRPNVIGRDCSTCATGYWGFPNCRPCTCGPRLCEPVTGDCICPPRTLLPDCTRCEPQTFGCHPVVGCEVCNCSRPGVTTPEASCDHDNGQCRCKNNIIGRQCDRCEAGFYGYPNCRPCDCNECRVGTFHLDPTNPKGCTSCFCFGGTDRCRSSDTRRTEIMDMVGWVLLGADKQEVPVTAYPGQDLVEADLSDVPDVYQDLHWHAPKTYLGDKVSSYGGYLRYRLHTQTMRGDALSLPAEGNQMTLVFMEREYSSPEEPHLGIVHLVEGSFLHAQTGNWVSREELMMVLVSLASLQVRALHSQSAHAVSLRGAVMEGAADQPSGRHANNVEICMCPANYQGDSCQRCAPGFYRDTKGLFLGKCVLCNCNGHSDRCLDGSGTCLDCQHNTVGDHCDRCQGGFLGNNSLHGQSCSSCPCPLQIASNNFAMGCVQKSNRMQCLCLPGYAGPNCERCAPGFYGNPMVVGSSCQPCGCHDNTDPNMLFSDCHSVTGECLSCMHHTAGPHCQRCSPGYHGDAITAKNCTKCNCSACGTESCDPQSGQCVCKPGVSGAFCDRCQEGFHGYDTCAGCRPCECGASAALLRSCDPASGQCSCQPGVNGPSCKQCAPGFWDYGPQGCKKCECKGGRCDPRTGECRCAEGRAIENYNSSLDDSRTRADMLDEEVHNIKTDISELENKVSATGDRVLDVTNSTNDTHQRALELLTFLSNTTVDIHDMIMSMNRSKKMADHERTEAQKLLSRVLQGLVSRQNNSSELAQDLRDRLAHFQLQMMDLRDLLNQARRVEELQANQKEVEDRLQMAEDDVAQVNDLLFMLHESKEEYERLAAQLDGARAPLADKVHDFSPVVSKIPLVELISGTNEDGFIGRALNASRAYSDIIKSVAEAEDAANQAHKAAKDTLESVNHQDLARMADSLKNHNLEPQVSDAQKRLVDLQDKQKVLEKELKEIQNNLNYTSEVSEELAEAKRAAQQANSTAAGVIRALAPIEEQLDQWDKSYGDANATNHDINHALMEANKTVSLLSDTIPVLMKKLDKLQNHSAQMPNISENISRIRQLIEQVSVPVKFNGTSGVQVRNPGNLADLAAYTSLKFFITLPEAARARRQGDGERQFVFYLGNRDSSKEFLGMALEGKRLRWYFNVGGQTAQVLMQEDVKSDGTFNNVVLERILQYGQMSMSSETSDGDLRVTKAHVEAGGDMGLLNLLTVDTVFYVGGYPASFKPPPQLELPLFKGCLELETLNEEVLSLYNFEKIFQLNTTDDKPYGRGKAVLTQQWVNDAAYFDGSGHAEVVFKDDSPRIKRFEQEVKLLSHNGILLMLHSQGRLRVYYNFNGTVVELESKDPASSHLKISDADPKALELIVLAPNRVVVRNNRNTLFNHLFTETIPAFSSSYYLGGVPQDSMPPGLRAWFPVQGSLKGCFRNLKAMGSHVDLKRMKSSGVSFGCANDLLKAGLMLYHQAQAQVGGAARSPSALSHSTPKPPGSGSGRGRRPAPPLLYPTLLLNHQAQDGVCQVFLDKGHVVVRAGNTEVRTQRTFNDGNSHYVALYSDSSGLRLYVDDSLEKAGEGGRGAGSGRSVAAATAGSFFLGGTPDQPTSNLTGCISNLFIKSVSGSQAVKNLLKVKENVNVPLDCPAAQKPQQIRAAPPKAKNKGKNRKPAASRSRSTRESCQGEPSPPETGAMHFSGSAHSYQRYDTLPREFSTSPHISLGMRVNSSEGLVLLTAQKGGGAVMSLSVSQGHLLLLVEGGKRKASLRSRRKYSDNQWHTVFIKRDGDKVSLVVDGINALSKRLPGGDKFRLSGPLYVGGAPLAMLAPGADGLVGCVRDLKLNEVPAGTPSHSQGAAPCFHSLLHPGAYFSGEGGHIAIDDSVVLGKEVELQVELRARSDSGLLLHSGTAEQSLNVVLSQGEMSFNAVEDNSVLFPVCPPDGAVGPSGRPSFHGCVRKATVNHRPVALSRPLGLHGPVGTQGCPHA
ncbi:hypothetical protein NHX12_013248, partial [Muraenolepis orangiensis]